MSLLFGEFFLHSYVFLMNIFLFQNETEWQIFLKTSIETIAMVAEYAPTETFDQVVNKYILYNIRKTFVNSELFSVGLNIVEF